jgi:1-acyl-sn-glycerol-3-phosphate acyltransferase
VVLKGGLVVPFTLAGLAILLVLRLAEWPLFGARRPLTPHITQFVCRFSLWVIGLKLRQHGRPMHHFGALVANHSTWLDIFVLNALDRVYFVAKTEVARWPMIGWLARATGTVFIERRGGAAGVQRQEFLDRLEKGHRLLFFPEGTSTDGLLWILGGYGFSAAFCSGPGGAATWLS